MFDPYLLLARFLIKFILFLIVCSLGTHIIRFVLIQYRLKDILFQKKDEAEII